MKPNKYQISYWNKFAGKKEMIIYSSNMESALEEGKRQVKNPIEFSWVIWRKNY